jgi:hypothetical protein
MSNIKKLFLIHFAALALGNLMLFIFLSYSQYESRIMHVITYDLRIVNQADIAAYENAESGIVNVIINHIYKSKDYEKLQSRFAVSKISPKAQVSNVLLISFLTNDNENQYDVAEKITIFLNNSILNYFNQVKKDIQASRESFLKAEESTILKIGKEERFLKVQSSVDYIIGLLGADNYISLLKNENDYNFFLKELINARSNFLKSNDKDFIAGVTKLQEILSPINDYKIPLKRNQKFSKPDSIEVLLDYIIESTRLSPSKLSLSLSLSILIFGLINCFYIIFFRSKYFFKT